MSLVRCVESPFLDELQKGVVGLATFLRTVSSLSLALVWAGVPGPPLSIKVRCGHHSRSERLRRRYCCSTSTEQLSPGPTVIVTATERPAVTTTSREHSSVGGSSESQLPSQGR